MRAGSGREQITPPLGTPMMGWATRDFEHGCTGVHDDLFVRALFLEHAGEAALSMGLDLCFLGREEADRVKGAIGRHLDLAPRQILLNASHTHDGPSVDTGGYQLCNPPDRAYLQRLERAAVSAARVAEARAEEASLWAGLTHSAVPMSRRRPDGRGGVTFAPDPAGPVCDALPVCLLKNRAGEPICLLFSVSCHPSTITSFEISRDYPGVAVDLLEARLGAPVGLFLQGCGGDAKPSVIGQGETQWRAGTWDDVAAAGAMLAQEVGSVLEGGLQEVEPRLCAQTVEMEWPLQPVPDRAAFEAIRADPDTSELRRLWAERQLLLLAQGYPLSTHMPITHHGLQLGEGLRVVGLEGEAVAEVGLLMQSFYEGGVTVPLGYCNGAQAYLPTSQMLSEGGYEVESYWEYGYPAPLAEGMEAILMQALEQLRTRGVG
jgi:neutral ceramidase